MRAPEENISARVHLLATLGVLVVLFIIWITVTPAQPPAPPSPPSQEQQQWQAYAGVLKEARDTCEQRLAVLQTEIIKLQRDVERLKAPAPDRPRDK